MAKRNFVVPIVAMLSVLGMSGCKNKDKASTPSIGENGNWWIGETDTGVAAQGPKGENGSSPTISINEDGFWVINGTATNVSAQGAKGDDGTSPTISINEDGYWVINGTVSDVHAQGPKGDDGTTPSITINDDGYWVINGVATTVKAEGTNGVTPTIEIGLDKCWIINGVPTGISAEGKNGTNGTNGTNGAPGSDGKTAFETFMEYYPHYTGTEADWIRGVADGTLAANMPKPGHSGDWSYNPKTGMIERTCSECEKVESKEAELPEFVSFSVGEDGLEGIFEVTNEGDPHWNFDAEAGSWTSGNAGIGSSEVVLKVKSLIAGSKLTFHVLASCEGGNYDYFSVSLIGSGTNSLGGTHVGSESGMEVDVELTFENANGEGSLYYQKDSSVNKGSDKAVVTNMMMSVPTSEIDPANRPSVVVVNFDAANGDADTQEITWAGGSVPMPTPTRSGYAFDGWFSDEACTVPAPETFDESCTLHAKWVVMHKVTIVDYEPDADDTVITVAHNATLDIEEPTNDEKLFGGYYVAPSCAPGTEFDIASPIKRDTIIYCKWTDAPAYCGKYGGANMWNANFLSGKSLTIAPNGTMTGYYTGTVTGINEDGSLIVTGGSSADKLYVVDDMIIGVSAYGADSDMYVFVKGHDAYSSAENPFIANTGISSTGAAANFNGRLFSIDRGGEVTNYCIFGDTLYKNVTVSSLDGDFVIGVSADTYGKDICVKDELGNTITTQIKRLSVDEDYGVYTDSEEHVLKVYGDGSKASLDGAAISYTKSGDDLTYIEGYVVTTYKSKQGSGWSEKTGKMEWDETESAWKHTINSSVTLTEYTDPSIVWEKTSDNYFAFKSNSYGNVVISLNKEGHSFSVARPEFTVVKHIGESSTEITVRSGNVVTLDAPEVSATQQFEGWFDNPLFSGSAITEMTTSGEVYAKIVDVYKLIVHKNLTEEDTTETIIFHADEVMTPPEVSLEGSDFVGWYTDVECETPYVPSSNVESVEIYAKWIKGKYSNSAANWFDSYDASEEFIDQITWDGGIYAWKRDTLDIGGTLYTGMKSGNYQVTTPCSIVVTFKADAVVSFDWLTEGESNYDYLTVLKNDTKVVDGKGKSTYDWSHKETGEPGLGSASILVSAGDTLTFKFNQDSTFYGRDCGFIYNLSIAAPAKANLTLDPNYGDATPVVSETSVGVVVNPSDPEARSGYAFDGWYLDAECETAFVEGTVMTDAGLTLYAKWVEAVNLTVHADEETVVLPLKPNTAPDLSSLEKEGYVIVGYYAEDTFETPVDLSSGISSDTEVYVLYLDASVFVGKYVGYNMMASTLGTEKTGNAILAYKASFNENLVGDEGKSNGKTITGYSDGILYTDGGVMFCAIADDGTVFLCNHYQGFRDTANITGRDLMFAVSTGDTYDTTVTIVNTQGEGNRWIVTVTKGDKVYTISLDFAANSMTIVSVVDAE